MGKGHGGIDKVATSWTLCGWLLLHGPFVGGCFFVDPSWVEPSVDSCNRYPLWVEPSVDSRNRYPLWVEPSVDSRNRYPSWVEVSINVDVG